MKKHNAMIARSGIQYYLDEELPGLDLREIPREYRGQRVFSVYRPAWVLEAAKDEFKKKPIRVGHKWVDNLADPAIIGYIDGDVSIKRNKKEVALCAPLDIIDDEKLPKFKELSPGYLSVNKWEPGVAPDGEPYEIVCTQIKSVNHLAIVEEARGGKDMKMLDGGNKKMIHSGLIRAVKRKLLGVMDEAPKGFEETVNELVENIAKMDEETVKAKTASLIDACSDLPDSDEKEKLLRYIADIPLLKDEDKAVSDEALNCIKESYKSLDSDALSEATEKPMEEEKKEEQKVDSAPEAAPKAEEQAPVAEPKKDEAPEAAPAPEEKKEDAGDVNAKILDALDALSKRLDAFLETKEEKKEEEEVKDEEPKEEKKDDGCGGVSDSLPRYTQSLSAIEKGYSLDDAFNRLKGRR